MAQKRVEQSIRQRSLRSLGLTNILFGLCLIVIGVVLATAVYWVSELNAIPESRRSFHQKIGIFLIVLGIVDSGLGMAMFQMKPWIVRFRWFCFLLMVVFPVGTWIGFTSAQALELEAQLNSKRT